MFKDNSLYVKIYYQSSKKFNILLQLYISYQKFQEIKKIHYF